MKKILTWLLNVFSREPRTPEMFLALVIEVQTRNNKEVSVIEIMKWGNVLQKVMRVDLYPFKKFGPAQAREARLLRC